MNAYKILNVTNFDQATTKAEQIIEEVFFHGAASGYTDQQIRAAYFILYKIEEVVAAERAIEIESDCYEYF